MLLIYLRVEFSAHSEYKHLNEENKNRKAINTSLIGWNACYYFIVKLQLILSFESCACAQSQTVLSDQRLKFK